MATKKKSSKPWKRKAPKGSQHTKLSGKSKAKAKRAARSADRKYPSLVDNMNAARKQRGRSRKKK